MPAPEFEPSLKQREDISRLNRELRCGTCKHKREVVPDAQNNPFPKGIPVYGCLNDRLDGALTIATLSPVEVAERKGNAVLVAKMKAGHFACHSDFDKMQEDIAKKVAEKNTIHFKNRAY